MIHCNTAAHLLGQDVPLVVPYHASGVHLCSDAPHLHAAAVSALCTVPSLCTAPYVVLDAVPGVAALGDVAASVAVAEGLSLQTGCQSPV